MDRLEEPPAPNEGGGPSAHFVPVDYMACNRQFGTGAARPTDAGKLESAPRKGTQEPT
jgi:hypothetical protein